MTNPHLSITTTALFPNIGRVNALLRQFFEGHRLRTADILDLRIAAEEILSNIARPGRIVKDPNRLIAVLIVVELSPTECVMCFEDDADPANPLHAPVPNTSGPLKDRPPGGLGIHLVRALMDHLDYERREERNRFTVAKRLPVVATAPA